MNFFFLQRALPLIPTLKPVERSPYEGVVSYKWLWNVMYHHPLWMDSLNHCGYTKVWSALGNVKKAVCWEGKSEEPDILHEHTADNNWYVPLTSSLLMLQVLSSQQLDCSLHIASVLKCLYALWPAEPHCQQLLYVFFWWQWHCLPHRTANHYSPPHMLLLCGHMIIMWSSHAHSCVLYTCRVYMAAIILSISSVLCWACTERLAPEKSLGAGSWAKSLLRGMVSHEGARQGRERFKLRTTNPLSWKERVMAARQLLGVVCTYITTHHSTSHHC